MSSFTTTTIQLPVEGNKRIHRYTISAPSTLVAGQGISLTLDGDTVSFIASGPITLHSDAYTGLVAAISTEVSSNPSGSWALYDFTVTDNTTSVDIEAKFAAYSFDPRMSNAGISGVTFNKAVQQTEGFGTSKISHVTPLNVSIGDVYSLFFAATVLQHTATTTVVSDVVAAFVVLIDNERAANPNGDLGFQQPFNPQSTAFNGTFASNETTHLVVEGVALSLGGSSPGVSQRIVSSVFQAPVTPYLEDIKNAVIAGAQNRIAELGHQAYLLRDNKGDKADDKIMERIVLLHSGLKSLDVVTDFSPEELKRIINCMNSLGELNTAVPPETLSSGSQIIVTRCCEDAPTIDEIIDLLNLETWNKVLVRDNRTGGKDAIWSKRATATGTGDQTGSDAIILRSSLWDGSKEITTDFVIEANASTTVNEETNLDFKYDGVLFWSINSDGAWVPNNAAFEEIIRSKVGTAIINFFNNGQSIYLTVDGSGRNYTGSFIEASKDGGNFFTAGVNWDFFTAFDGGIDVYASRSEQGTGSAVFSARNNQSGSTTFSNLDKVPSAVSAKGGGAEEDIKNAVRIGGVGGDKMNVDGAAFSDILLQKILDNGNKSGVFILLPNAGGYQKITITGNLDVQLRGLGSGFSGILTLEITQDNVGTHTISWSAGTGAAFVKFPGGTQFDISLGVGESDLYKFQWDGDGWRGYLHEKNYS